MSNMPLADDSDASRFPSARLSGRCHMPTCRRIIASFSHVRICRCRDGGTIGAVRRYRRTKRTPPSPNARHGFLTSQSYQSCCLIHAAAWKKPFQRYIAATLRFHYAASASPSKAFFFQITLVSRRGASHGTSHESRASASHAVSTGRCCRAMRAAMNKEPCRASSPSRSGR